jgi:hypothetical protein
MLSMLLALAGIPAATLLVFSYGFCRGRRRGFGEGDEAGYARGWGEGHEAGVIRDARRYEDTMAAWSGTPMLARLEPAVVGGLAIDPA